MNSALYRLVCAVVAGLIALGIVALVDMDTSVSIHWVSISLGVALGIATTTAALIIRDARSQKPVARQQKEREDV